MVGMSSVDSEGSCILPIEVLSDVAMVSAAISIGQDGTSAEESGISSATWVDLYCWILYISYLDYKNRVEEGIK